MDPDSELRKKIMDTLTHKAGLKQRVAHNTFVIFNELKDALHELVTEINDELEEKVDKRIRLEYRDRGKLEAQAQVADDVMIFSMHTDVFRFPKEHPVWDNPYVKEDKDNAYCGIINIYNFLADSFKFNRATDQGYLIGRIFVNHDMQYFVEGKKQVPQRAGKFGTRRIDREALVEILEAAMGYSLGFDLLVPPFASSKIVSVEQFNTKTEYSKLQIGKLLDYDYDCEDI